MLRALLRLEATYCALLRRRTCRLKNLATTFPLAWRLLPFRSHDVYLKGYCEESPFSTDFSITLHTSPDSMAPPKLKGRRKHTPTRARLHEIEVDIEDVPVPDINLDEPDELEVPELVLNQEPETQEEGDIHQEEYEDDDEQQASTSAIQEGPHSPIPSTSSFVPPPKKTYRKPHKQIPNYKFTEEQIEQLRDFVRDNPSLYVKKNPLYADHKNKIDLWMQCATLFDDCSYVQCRKFYEQKRTAFGKLEAKHIKSGSAALHMTARDELLMQRWGFLKGHICHSSTTSSQVFTSANDSSSDMEGGLSEGSIARRKLLKKQRTADTSASSHDVTSEDKHNQPTDVDITDLRKLINVASNLNTNQQTSFDDLEIDAFTKMIGFQVKALHKSYQRKAMLRALAVINEYDQKPIPGESESSTSTVLPTVVHQSSESPVAVSTCDTVVIPTTSHTAVVATVSQTRVAPSTCDRSLLSTTSHPAVIATICQPPFLAHTSHAPVMTHASQQLVLPAHYQQSVAPSTPNQMSPLNNMGLSPFMNPPTPGSPWMWPPQPRCTTPYHHQMMSYGVQSPNVCHSPFNICTVFPTTSMQATQHTMPSTQPYTSVADMFPSTTTSYTTLLPPTTTNEIMHLVESIPTVTAAMPVDSKDSSLHTPDLQGDAADKN